MARSLFTRKQRQAYGRYNGAPTFNQLAQHFFLDDYDLQTIGKLRKPENRLGFSIQLCTLRFLGTAVKSINEVPLSAVKYLGKQLNIRDIQCRHKYTERNLGEHFRQIKSLYGYKDFNDTKTQYKFIRWLYARTWTADEQLGVLFDVATRQLVTSKIILPGATTLERLIKRVRKRSYNRLIRMIDQALNSEHKQRLQTLLLPQQTENSSLFNFLLTPVPGVNSTSILALLDKLQQVRNIQVTHINLTHLPKTRLAALAKRTAKNYISNLRRMSEQQRMALLLTFAQATEIRLIDELADLVEAFIGDMQRTVKNEGKKHRLRTLKDLDEAAQLLSMACGILLNEEIEPSEIRAKTFQCVSKTRITEAMDTVKKLSRPKDDQYQQEWLAQYHRIKRFLPRLINSLRFRGTVEGKPLLEAMEYMLPFMLESTKTNEAFKPPLELIPKGWKKHVVQEKKANLQAYVVCITQQFRELLIRRDIFILHSERWNDPRLRLLKGKEWQHLKPSICRALNLSEDPQIKLDELKSQLDASYQLFLQALPNNNDVRFETQKNKSKMIVSPLDKLDEPASLLDLKEQIKRVMPLVDLPEILLEIHTRTGFADAFFHVSENESRASDLHISICAVLIAQACNIGLEPLIQPGHPALTRSRLQWVKQNYIRPETLAAANNHLVQLHTEIPLVNHWGSGEIASADGLRFVAPAHTAYTRYNKKYFEPDKETKTTRKQH